MEKVSTSPDDHIDLLPAELRADVARLDAEISRVSGLKRTLWQGKFWGGTQQSIIGYGDVAYKRPKGKDVEWFIVGLAVQKNYISVYINATEGKRYLPEAYADKLGKAKVGKSSISFKKLSDINLPVLLELVTKAKQQLG